MTNSQYAHELTTKKFAKLYSLLLENKKIITKKVQEEWESAYFAMCLLIPKDSLLKVVEIFGGLEKVLNDYQLLSAISRLYNVEEQLMEIRIKDLLKNDREYERVLEKAKEGIYG